MQTLSGNLLINRPNITAETYLILKQAVELEDEDSVPDSILSGYLDMITGTGGGLKCNVVRMLVEQWELLNTEAKPLFAYVSAQKDAQGRIEALYVTGWMGNVYGRCGLGREYRCGFGGNSRRHSVSATINGRDYYGTNYGGVGMYCRLKPGKAKGGK